MKVRARSSQIEVTEMPREGDGGLTAHLRAMAQMESQRAAAQDLIAADLKTAQEQRGGMQQPVAGMVGEKEAIPVAANVPTTVVPGTPPPSTNSSVLIDLRGGAGDAIMGTEAARQVKQRYPGCKVTLYVRDEKQVNLVSLCPWVDDLQRHPSGPPLSGDGFTRSYCLRTAALRGWWKGQRHLLEMIGDGLRIPLENRAGHVYLEPAAVAWARNWWAEHPVSPRVVVHSGASSPEKCWPPARWDEFAAQWESPVVAIGDGHPAKGAIVLPVSGASWQHMAALLAQADLLVTNDSGPMHVAAGVGCPVVAMWGATAPVNSGIMVPGAVVNLLPQRKECKRWGVPCHKPCEFQKDSEDYCMAGISAARVVEAARDLLGVEERPPVTFVVVTWNAGAMTAATLAKMHQHSGLVDLVIVDNGSRPDEWEQIAAALKPWGKKAQVLHNEENLGYPIAANQGLRAARGDVIWLINPDVDIRADDWHLPVLDFLAANPRVGIVCGCENERAYRFDRRHGAVGQLAAGDHVNGCSFAIRRACWWMVGDPDEAFSPGLLEETDFCLRAWRQGWESWMVPVALRHEHRSQVVAANGDVWRDEWKAKNRAYFSEKWAGVYGEVSGAAIWPPI